MKKHMPRRHMLLGLTGAGISCAWIGRSQKKVPCANSIDDFSVVRFGARRDGISQDTSAIQTAIDNCSQAGGGTVTFPSGRYLSGTLFLRSHVRLFLDERINLFGNDLQPAEEIAALGSDVSGEKVFLDGAVIRDVSR